MTVLVVDTNSIATVSYYNKKGNLLQVFNILQAVIENFEIDTAYFMFDYPPYFRNLIYPDYKATREDDQKRNIYISAIYRTIEEVYGQVYRVQGYEADDLIATAVKQIKKENQVLILSGDKDLWQLVDSNVFCIYHNRIIDVATFYEKMGFYPDQYTKYKALRGDTGDNIKGVKGIGDKRAKGLLDWDVEKWDVDETNLTKTVKKNLRGRKDEYELALKLVKLYDDAPIDLSSHRPLNIRQLVTHYQRNYMKEN